MGEVLCELDHDNNGFFYSRYPEPENKLESVNEHQKLYFHQMAHRKIKTGSS